MGVDASSMAHLGPGGLDEIRGWRSDGRKTNSDGKTLKVLNANDHLIPI
jgi:hypothetical protein